jgi:hypothetical protein
MASSSPSTDPDVDPAGGGVARDVGQCLAQGGEELAGDLVWAPGIERSLEHDAGLEPERLACLPGDVEHPAADAVARGCAPDLETEDRGADVPDDQVEVVDCVVHPALHGRGVVAHEGRGALEGQAGREEALDDRVMEVAGDALAVVDQRQLLDAGVQPGVLDRHAGRGGQPEDQLLVDVRENLARGLVGQVQVAEHLVPHPHGHAEEGPHGRVVGREAVASGCSRRSGRSRGRASTISSPRMP